MRFVKPELASLLSESDVEQQFIYPLLVSKAPTGLGFESAQIQSKKHIRKFSIGKGTDLKSYYPDFVIVRSSIPLIVIEAKPPGSNLEEAFREARLYASELNSVHPSGLNPVSRVIAIDGTRLLAGWYDQKTPKIDMSYSEIDSYSPKMSELIALFGSDIIEKTYLSLVPYLRAKKYWKPLKLVGGLAKQKEQVPFNSFGSTIGTDFSSLFNPQSRDERRFIAKYAYITSKRRERYIEPIDKVIRAATPPSVAHSKTLDDTGRPVEIIKPFRNARALEQKIMLLVGGAGAGKSTFVDYLQEVALPPDIRSKTIWIRVDMNPAPISRDEIYPWLREEIISGCIIANPKDDFNSLELIKAVHSVEINDFRKGIGRLYEKNKETYDAKLAELLTAILSNRHTVARNMARYCSTERGHLLVIVLDNSDKRLREEQLLMFEAAQWLQREFRGLVVLPLREETYDNHRNEPPLDTALKDLVFRIEPPLFQKILASRISLALRELNKQGGKMLKYDLPNGIQVEYPASDQGFYFSSIIRSIFEHDRYIRRLIVGLSGRNMRRALELFLEFCTSGHIGADEITKIRLSEGTHVLPLSLVTNVLLRVNQRFYESDDSYIKNVFSADIDDIRPNVFGRLLILRLLFDHYSSALSGQMKGYVRVHIIRKLAAKLGLEEEAFRRELEYLIRAFCIVCEDFRQKDITDDDLVSIAPAGHVHNSIYLEQYYLSAIAEDSWFEDAGTAQGIADRVSDIRYHYDVNTALENAEDMLDELERHYRRDLATYSALYSDNEFQRLIDLMPARRNLIRFETENVSGAWIGKRAKYLTGSIHDAQVENIAQFGVFVRFEPGIDGLIHSSKLRSNFRTDSRYTSGSPIRVKVLAINRISQRIELDLA